jgi:ElaB/YqjD/DUF883 family membrane-anchored ribosome-binding protein
MNAHVATAIGSNGAGRAKEAVRSPLEVLFDGVDDLIRRVADTENPEIRKTRAKVHAALVAAKSEFAAKSVFEDTAKQLNRARDQAVQAVQANRSADDPLRDYPGSALGVALLVGIGLGLVVSLRQ